MKEVAVADGGWWLVVGETIGSGSNAG